MSWIGAGGPPEAFAKSYARLPQAEKANAAVRHAIEYGENTYCRASWWTGLPQAVRDGVVASLLTMKAPPVCQRGPDGLCLDGKIFAARHPRRRQPGASGMRSENLPALAVGSVNHLSFLRNHADGFRYAWKGFIPRNALDEFAVSSQGLKACPGRSFLVCYQFRLP
jgi:hypothetical protein